LHTSKLEYAFINDTKQKSMETKFQKKIFNLPIERYTLKCTCHKKI
jgi:hypothetical protein